MRHIPFNARATGSRLTLAQQARADAEFTASIDSGFEVVNSFRARLMTFAQVHAWELAAGGVAGILLSLVL